MKNVGLALMLAAILAGQIALSGRDTTLLLVAPAAVLFGVVAASCLMGELTWLTVLAGGASPVALTWLAGSSATLGLGAMCLLWLAPRLWLSRTPRELLGLAGVSLAAATLAGFITAHFVAAVPLYHFTSCVFGGASLALATVVLPTDTVVSSSLETAARLLDGSVADALRRAADRHRQTTRMPSREQAKEGEWRGLLRLCDQRLGLRDLSGPDFDSARAEADERILSAIQALVGKAPSSQPEKSEKEQAPPSEKPSPAEEPPAAPEEAGARARLLADPSPPRSAPTEATPEPAPESAQAVDNPSEAVDPAT